MLASLIGCLVQVHLPYFFGSLSHIRVTLLFAVRLILLWNSCTHMSDRQWRALLRDALHVAQQTLSASSITRQGMNTCPRGHEPCRVREGPVRIGCWRFRSCHASHLVPTEFHAINPHRVEQDGEFACDSRNGAMTTLDAYQSHCATRRYTSNFAPSPWRRKYIAGRS
jgi:hypothetical protein